MPSNKKERALFALITVIITVHAYVFYSLYVVNGSTFLNLTNANTVLEAINKLDGVYMFGHYLPIWLVVLVEFCFAYGAEMFIGQPLSFKLACKNFDIKKTDPVQFETAVICATVAIMVPIMSLIAAFLYYPYYSGFRILTLLANFIKLICFNFPFAYFSQLFFIQPFVRTIFRFICRKKKNVNNS